jgi:hypothetical protein
MTGRRDDDFDLPDSRALNDFLRGEDELSRALNKLPQPQPPEELTRRILADAERALGSPAANDNLPPGSQRPPSGHWFRRFRFPLAAAASVIIAVLVSVQWRYMPAEQETILAGTPTGSPGAPANAAPEGSEQRAAPPTVGQHDTRPRAPDRPQPPAPPPEPARQDHTMLAQQAPPDLAQGGTIMRGGPQLAKPTPESNVTDSPRAWLSAIEKLLQEDRLREARRAWQQFRAAHPEYTVPEALAKQLDALPP